MHIKEGVSAGGEGCSSRNSRPRGEKPMEESS